MAYKCPHCEKEITLPEEEVMLKNAENYGSSVMKSMCPKCDHAIRVGVVRKAMITSIYKGVHNSDETDF